MTKSAATVAFLLGLGALFHARAAAPPPAYPGRMGVEASGDAFVDIARQSYRWEKPDGRGGWTAVTHDDVDEHGWPRTDCRWITDSRPCAEWAGQIDDPEVYRVDYSGVYKGSFHGSARLIPGAGSFSIGHQTYDSTTNLTTFELTVPKPGPNVSFMILEFADTHRSPGDRGNTGIADFKLIRPGYPADTTQIFTNQYLDCFKSAAFSTIRFMGVMGTNGNVEWGKDHTRTQSWSNRKLPGDAAVVPIDPLDKKDGWPWEFVVSLCNEENMDMWIDIPMSVDDDYIRQLAMLIHSSLKPGLNIYIEHSNEVWNFGFIQYAWNKAKAKEEVREGQGSYNFDHINKEEIWAQRRHAQRLHDIVGIFGNVFGKAEINRRIRGVLAGWTPYPDGFFVCGRLSSMLEYLKATSGDPKESIYAISIAMYYGGKAASGQPGTEASSVEQVLEDMRAGSDGSRKEREAMVELARQYGLRGGFCAYESGPDIGGGRTANIANRIRAIRDPGQAELYKRNFADNFWDLGGNLAMQFAIASPYSRFGAYGLTDDAANPDRNYLFRAVRQLIGGGTHH